MRLYLLAVGMAVLTGCAAGPATVVHAASDAAPSHTSLAAPRPFLEAAGCDEGGSYVTWNFGTDDPPLPFHPADIGPDVGDIPFNSDGAPPHAGIVPVRGNITGAYHAVLTCADWTMDGISGHGLTLAFVVGRVMPPPFDPHPVPRQYGVGVVGVADAHVASRMQDLGFPVEILQDTSLSYSEGVLSAQMHFSSHGDIVTAIPVASAGPKQDETTRFWFAGENQTALDFVETGGMHYWASSPGWFEHTVGGVPVHSYTSWALGYRGFALALAAGPTASVPAHNH